MMERKDKGEVDSALRHFVETEIIPRYAAFDMAHQIDHAETVIANSLEVC